MISGLSSNEIRQRLLEDRSLTLKTAYDRARTLDLAQKNSEEYVRNVTPVYSAATGGAEDEEDSIGAANSDRNTCYFCGNNRHPRKTAQLTKPFVTIVKRKVISIMLVYHHLLLLLQLEYLLVYHTL